jgi:hypothetical protein
MGAPNKYTVNEIAEKLEKFHGAITLAAESLGASYNTVKKYIDKSSTLKEIMEKHRERRVDKAELKLEQAIDNGEPWAISLILKTQGKARGYVERQEITGKDGQEVTIKVVYDE